MGSRLPVGLTAGPQVLDGVLYVAGGFDSKHDLATVEKLDPKTNTWQLVAKMQKKRSGLALHVVSCRVEGPRGGERILQLNHKLCAIGGYDGLKYLSGEPSTDLQQACLACLTHAIAAIESYDPRLDEWNLEHDVT